MIFLINTYWERENWLISVECHWLYKLHSRVGHVPRSIWETQNRLHHVWVVFLFHFALFGQFEHFFLFWDIYLLSGLYFHFSLFLRDRKRKRGGRLSREKVRGRDGETQKEGEKKRENKVM